jgi:peptide/nickel transport system permease protein
MRRYFLQRIFLLLFLLWAVSSLIFFLIHLIPGDPVESILGEGARIEDVQRLRHDLKLDRPLMEQYFEYNKGLLTFNFGTSIFNNQKVLVNVLKYLPNTILLAFLSVFISILISIPLGTLAAFNDGRALDSFVTFFSSAGLAIPNFFLGPLLIILFSIKLQLFPVSGSETLSHVFLPAITLGTGMCAYLTRIVRTSVGVELQKPYVLFARARGLNNFDIFRKHVFKNALIPIITTVGLQFGALLSGTIITETIFSWQGIGLLLIKSINRRDYPMVQGLIVIVTFIYLLINFLVDISYFFIDPRIKNEYKQK